MLMHLTSWDLKCPFLIKRPTRSGIPTTMCGHFFSKWMSSLRLVVLSPSDTATMFIYLPIWLKKLATIVLLYLFFSMMIACTLIFSYCVLIWFNKNMACDTDDISDTFTIWFYSFLNSFFSKSYETDVLLSEFDCCTWSSELVAVLVGSRSMLNLLVVLMEFKYF